MNIVMRGIDTIHPYGNNPRKNDDAIQPVANSIKEFGFKVPIIIDSSGEIVTGHTRYKAAKLLGMTEVPCIVADDLDEKQIQAFRLADNKVGEFAKWDEDALAQEIAALTGSFDMSELFGFVTKEAQYALPGLESHVTSFFESGSQAKPKPAAAQPAPGPDAAPGSDTGEDAELFPMYFITIPEADHDAMTLISEICKGRGIICNVEAQ